MVTVKGKTWPRQMINQRDVLVGSGGKFPHVECVDDLYRLVSPYLIGQLAQ